MTFNKRLSLNDAIALVLRKVQVSSTLVKVLNIRREVGICEKLLYFRYFVYRLFMYCLHVCACFLCARVSGLVCMYACAWIHVLFLMLGNVSVCVFVDSCAFATYMCVDTCVCVLTCVRVYMWCYW